MATQPQTGLTYDDLQAFPEDNFRRELIDGELIVTAAPGGRHQDVVLELGARLLTYSKDHGGKVYVAPRDVYFAQDTVVEPDVVYVRAENVPRIEERFIAGAPDVVIEVSSPSTRRLEVVRKRELYERMGVPEYWYIDLEAERVEIYALKADGYGAPRILLCSDDLTSPQLPGFTLSIEELLGPPPD